MAAPGCRFHRPEGRGGRHRVVGDSIDSDHRRPGRQPDRIPADGQLLRSRVQRTGAGREAIGSRDQTRPVPGAGPLVYHRCACAGEHATRAAGDRRRAPRAVQAAWTRGGIIEILGTFNDLLTNAEANETFAEFVRGKIRAVVRDPATADALCPRNYPIGTKRLCLDTNYFETFNLPHVRLVDLRSRPITTITDTGIDLADESLDFDAIVFATGFDAMTGPIVAVDIVGRDGLSLKQKWAGGPRTYLGLTVAGFPNLFTVTGPGSPSVLSNMVVSIEQHVEWITDCLTYMQREQLSTIEPTSTAEEGWVQYVNDFGDITLFPRADSWYMGANVPGKPRVFLPYVGGVGDYRKICNEVAARDYLGFRLAGSNEVRVNDGVVRGVQPDVAMMLEMVKTMGLPPIESLSVKDARTMSAAFASQRPSGPEVGECVDGMLPGAGGDLAYRLYRPATPGPHPAIVLLPRRRVVSVRTRQTIRSVGTSACAPTRS